MDSSDTTSFPIADFTRSANSWFRKLVFLIWKNTSTWEFDDSNQTTLPVATTDLVDTQQDYELPATALDVQRVEVLDSNGNYQVMQQFDKAQVPDWALTEHYETAGMPTYYDVMANSVLLYPKPSSSNVTTTAGLKLYLTRDISEFGVTSTSKEPGIQETFHPYLAYGAAMDYAIAKNLAETNRVGYINNTIQKYENDIKEHAAKRNKDFKVKFRPRTRGTI